MPMPSFNNSQLSSRHNGQGLDERTWHIYFRYMVAMWRQWVKKYTNLAKSN